MTVILCCLSLCAIQTSAPRWYSPEMAAVAAWPSSWGSGPVTSFEAPAGITRIEGIDVATGYSDIAGRHAFTCGGTRIGPLHAALGAGWAGGSDSVDDSLSFSAAAAWVVTGDPAGFIEGFFGPSISIGAASRVLFPGDGLDTQILGSAGLQFSVFPTFALGITETDIPVSTPSGSGIEADTHWGATYIFSRELRIHASVSGDGPAFGAELAVNPSLKARTGTSGESWNAGASLSLGSLTLDYAVVLDDSSIGHSVSARLSLGGENWY